MQRCNNGPSRSRWQEKFGRRGESNGDFLWHCEERTGGTATILPHSKIRHRRVERRGSPGRGAGGEGVAPVCEHVVHVHTLTHVHPIIISRSGRFYLALQLPTLHTEQRYKITNKPQGNNTLDKLYFFTNVKGKINKKPSKYFDVVFRISIFSKLVDILLLPKLHTTCIHQMDFFLLVGQLNLIDLNQRNNCSRIIFTVMFIKNKHFIMEWSNKQVT